MYWKNLKPGEKVPEMMRADTVTLYAGLSECGSLTEIRQLNGCKAGTKSIRDQFSSATCSINGIEVTVVKVGND